MTFESFDFESDPRWSEFVNSTSVSFVGSEREIQLKLKQRFYKKFIDPDFDPNSSTSSSSSSSTSSSSSSSSSSSTSSSSSSSSNTTHQGAPIDWKQASINKLVSGEAAWLFLSLTLIFSGILYLVPIIGWNPTNYYRALYSGAFVYLYSVVKSPNFRFSKDYIPVLLEDDNWNYFLFSIVFSLLSPHLLVVVPLILYSVLGVSYWIQRNAPTFTFLRKLVPTIEVWVVQQYNAIMIWAAYSEFMLLPSLFFTIFSAGGSLVGTLYCATFFKRRYRKSGWFRLVGQGIGQKADSLVYSYLPSSFYSPYQNAKLFLQKYLC